MFKTPPSLVVSSAWTACNHLNDQANMRHFDQPCTNPFPSQLSVRSHPIEESREPPPLDTVQRFALHVILPAQLTRDT